MARRRRYLCWGASTLAIVTVLVMLLPLTTQGASGFAAPAFGTQWSSVEGVIPNFWGPLTTAREGQPEPYIEGNVNGEPGRRLVQYFDKARMELTTPDANVTNGLLTVELKTGAVQLGNTTFQQYPGANVGMAGDVGSPGPTYASLSQLPEKDTQRSGSVAFTYNAGTNTFTSGMASSDPNAVFASYLTDSAGRYGQNIPKAFADFLARIPGGSIPAMGYPVTPAFAASVRINGVENVPVIIQAFERKVLTYTPSNQVAFQVEFGNIGQHYYQWRYVTLASSGSSGATNTANAANVSDTSGFPTTTGTTTFGSTATTDPYATTCATATFTPSPTPTPSRTPIASSTFGTPTSTATRTPTATPFSTFCPTATSFGNPTATSFSNSNSTFFDATGTAVYNATSTAVFNEYNATSTAVYVEYYATITAIARGGSSSSSSNGVTQNTDMYNATSTAISATTTAMAKEFEAANTAFPPTATAFARTATAEARATGAVETREARATYAVETREANETVVADARRADDATMVAQVRAINATYVAQTAEARATQTANARFALTATPTGTPSPTNTPTTGTQTATANTPTPTVDPTMAAAQTRIAATGAVATIAPAPGGRAGVDPTQLAQTATARSATATAVEAIINARVLATVATLPLTPTPNVTAIRLTVAAQATQTSVALTQAATPKTTSNSVDAMPQSVPGVQQPPSPPMAPQPPQSRTVPMPQPLQTPQPLPPLRPLPTPAR